MTLNVCMVTRDFWPNIGGIAAHVVGLTSALTDLGCSVSIIAPRTGAPAPSPLNLADAKVHWVYQRFRRSAFAIPEFAIRGSWAAVKLEEHFDVVHWHDLWADPIIARLIRGRARIFTNHSSGFVRRSRHPAWRSFIRRWHPQPSLVIGPSTELARLSGETFTGVPTCFVPNGVDPRMFKPKTKPNALLKQLALGAEHLVVLIPRRLESKNGVEYALRAVPMIRRETPEARVLIAGSGELERPLSKLSRALGVDRCIRFLGAIPNSHMTDYYCASDIVVIPSLIEATSISALEAMACGKPLVATDVGGIPEVVQHKVTGLLVPCRDPEAIARSVITLLRDTDVRLRMGRAGLERVLQNFTWREIAKKTLALYERALCANPSAASN